MWNKVNGLGTELRQGRGRMFDEAWTMTHDIIGFLSFSVPDALFHPSTRLLQTSNIKQTAVGLCRDLLSFANLILRQKVCTKNCTMPYLSRNIRTNRPVIFLAGDLGE